MKSVTRRATSPAINNATKQNPTELTLAETHIAPWYTVARALYGPTLFPAPTYEADIEPGGPNAEAALIGLVPRFRWRSDYPSPAMDEPLRSDEIRRTAAHEIGHPFEHLCLALGIDVHRRYFEFRQYTGTWAQWAAEPWKQVREGFADCFGAALLGEWLVPVGNSQADRFYNEGKTVTAAAARAFFVGLAGATVPGVTWLPSPNYGRGGVRGVAGRTKPIRYIVLHTTQGFDSRGWLTNVASGVSCHSLVREDDDYQLVRDEDTAWHAGSIVARRTATGRPTTPLYTGEFLGFTIDGREIWSVNPNDESLGLEIEGFAADAISPIRFNRTLLRIRAWRQKYGPLPLVAHAELSPGDRSDPGAANFAAIKAAADGGEDDMYTDADRARDEKVAAQVAQLEVRTTNIEVKVAATAENIVKVWLRRAFYGLDPLTRQKPTTSPPTPPADLP
jgi:hypothetical protein